MSSKENIQPKGGGRMSMPVQLHNKNMMAILSPSKQARRSLAPRKSILKFNNAPEEDITEVTTFFGAGDGRKSLARRVSFAAHAQVRLYNKEANQSPGTPPTQPKPNPPPAARISFAPAATIRPDSLGNDATPDSSMEVENLAREGDGDRDVSFDDGPPDDEEEEEEDMDITTFGAAHPLPPPRASTPNPRHSTEMEFTVALGHSLPSKRKSLANDAWADLQALQPPQQSPTNDMDVPTAMSRMLMASPLSRKSIGQFGDGLDEGDSGDMSLDGEDGEHTGFSNEDRTMDFTSILPPPGVSLNDEPLPDEEDMMASSVTGSPVNKSVPPPASTNANPTPSTNLFSGLNFSFGPSASASASTPPKSFEQHLNLSTSTPRARSAEPEASQSGLFSTLSSVFTQSSPNKAKSSIPKPVFVTRQTSAPPDVPAPTPKRAVSIPTITFSTPQEAPAKPASTLFAPTESSARKSVGEASRKSVGDTSIHKSVGEASIRKSVGEVSTRQSLGTESPTRRTSIFGSPSRPANGPLSPIKREESRKRPASPEPLMPSVKRLAVEGHGNSGSPRRATSADLTPQTASSRETSAPPELQSSTSNSRRSFAQRRAVRRSSHAPAPGGIPGELSVIQEGRESLGNATFALQNVEEEETMDVTTLAMNATPNVLNRAMLRQEPILGEYEKPIGAEGRVNRSPGDRPKVSVAEFLDMAGIHFHDSMPVQRRHTMVGADVMTLRDGSTGPIPDEGQGFGLADYYDAEMVYLPQMDTYKWVTEEMKDQMAKYKQHLALLEEEIQENPPAALLDFLEADDEVRPQIEYAFKQAKSYAKRTTRKAWYEWRSKWTQELQPHADHEIRNLEIQIALVKQQREKLRAPTDELAVLHAQLKEELEQERAKVAEIEACDPEALESLKAGISEQNIVVDGYKAEVAQARAELERCTSILKERQAEVQSSQDTIVASQRRGELLGTTKEDVIKCKAFFDNIQELQGWKIVKVSPTLIEALHIHFQLLVRIPMTYSRPLISEAVVERVPDQHPPSEDSNPRFPGFYDALLVSGQDSASKPEVTGHRELVRHLDATWTSYDLVLTELRCLWIKHPLTIACNPDGSLVATVTLIARHASDLARNGKALVDLTFNKAALGSWPHSMKDIHVAVRVIYGQLQAEDVQHSIRRRLDSAPEKEHYCTLFDAFAEAVGGRAES